MIDDDGAGAAAAPGRNHAAGELVRCGPAEQAVGRRSSMRLKTTYSAREVAALTGLTARRLQVWDASGLLSPSIPTRRTAAGGYTERRYTPIELFELLVLAELRRRGFSVFQLRAIVRGLKQEFGTRLFDATGGGGPVTLLTDGREVYARTARGELFNLLDTPPQPLLIVGNEGLLKELRGKVRRKRSSRPRKPRKIADR
jgi:DNA-binding transcriptional MerR regulator